jgi:Holliday junction resolvase
MGKGTRRERQACEIYEQAGYETYRPATVQFGENDVFGLFDLIAVDPGRKPRYVQVKSNGATGIKKWTAEVFERMPMSYMEAEYAVPYDGEGWRVVKPVAVDPHEHVTLFDGRESDANMGEGLAEWLQERQ